MTNILRQVALWNGFPGAPGDTTWYFAGGTTTNVVQMRNFFAAIASLLPSSVTVQVQNTGDVVTAETGVATGSGAPGGAGGGPGEPGGGAEAGVAAGWWSQASAAVVTGTAGGGYSGPSGVVMRLETGVFVAGRRLRGRSFLVPMAGSIQDTNGTVAATPLGTLNTAAAAAVTASGTSWLVWHRPVGGSGGSVSPVTSAGIPDKIAVLRSRRD